MSEVPIVRLAGVSKEFGSGETVVHALRDIGLEIGKGEFVTLAGPSGSGKSTLLNVIGGLDRPSTGTVEIEGNDLGKLGGTALSLLRRKRIGFIFQAYNLIPVLTALENAEYVLLLQGVPAVERRRRILELFERVGLSGLQDRFPREMSGGQQQRVAIVRAVVSEPALVLADEPTANVDSKTGGALMDMMSHMNAEHRVTFLFSTHDPRVIERAGRRVVLRDGVIDKGG